MKVVFLNPIGTIGGAERSLLDMMASLQRHSPDLQQHLVVGADGGLATEARQFAQVHILEMPEELTELGDSYVGGAGLMPKFGLAAKMALAGLSGTAYVGKLRRLLLALQPDVVHSNGFKMHVLGAYAKPSGVPFIWHVRDYVTPRFVMSKALRRSAHLCDQAIAISKSVAQDLSMACPQLPVQVMEDVIDLNRFRPQGSRLDLDAIAKLPNAVEGTIRIGLVATFAKWKGHDVFLRAIAKLPQHAQVRAYIVGGAQYQTKGSQWSLEELKSLAAQLGITVGFTGFVDSAAAMRSLDIVVHASVKPEPLGLVIPEAMACGKPVVVANAGGAAELFTEGVDAVGHRSGNADDLALVLKPLIACPLRRFELGRKAYSHAVQRFGRQRLGSQLERIYRNLRQETDYRVAA